MYYNSLYFMPPFIPSNCDKPPTLYSILESIVNYGKSDKTKIKNLAKEGRKTIFDFDYPLTSNVSRGTFEEMILNRFLMRRIGFETVNAFKIQLNVTLNSIMPMYNKMFDSLYIENFLGSTQIREGFDKTSGSNSSSGNTNTQNTSSLSNTSNTNTNNTSDRRFSDTPENELYNVRDGKYVTEYNYDTNTANGTDTSSSNGSGTNTESRNDTSSYNDDKNYKETITNLNGLDSLIKLKENTANIYEMIFRELEPLFYQLI